MRTFFQVLFALIAMGALLYTIGIAGSLDLNRLASDEGFRKMGISVCVFAGSSLIAWFLGLDWEP